MKAKVKDGWVMLATSLKKGERVRLIGNNREGIHEVLEVAQLQRALRKRNLSSGVDRTPGFHPSKTVPRPIL